MNITAEIQADIQKKHFHFPIFLHNNISWNYCVCVCVSSCFPVKHKEDS